LTNWSALATSAAKPPSQGGQRGGFRCRSPEARKFRVGAKLAVGERQLGGESRAPRSAGKLMQALEPRPAPLEGVAQTCGTGGARPEAALELGMFHQRLDLKPAISGGRKPPDDLGANALRPQHIRTRRRGCRRRLWRRNQ